MLAYSGTLVGAAVVFFTTPVSAELVAQVGRCQQPARAQIPNPLTVSFGNEPSTREVEVTFAYARADDTDSKAQSIADTHRIEICTAKPDGSTTAVSCPGWQAGKDPWIIFDRNASIGTEPTEDLVKDAKHGPLAGPRAPRLSGRPLLSG